MYNYEEYNYITLIGTTQLYSYFFNVWDSDNNNNHNNNNSSNSSVLRAITLVHYIVPIKGLYFSNKHSVAMLLSLAWDM